MHWFAKLPGYRTTPPGLERQILRRLPRLSLYGSLLLALPALLGHLLAEAGADWLGRLDIYTISLVILYWTVLLTVAIAAVIVLVMKGPAYVADAYALDEQDSPPDEASR